MRQFGDGSGFDLETEEPLFVGDYRRRQHFQCDASTQARIQRSVNLAHAAGADRLNNLIRSDARVGCQRQR